MATPDLAVDDPIFDAVVGLLGPFQLLNPMGRSLAIPVVIGRHGLLEVTLAVKYFLMKSTHHGAVRAMCNLAAALHNQMASAQETYAIRHAMNQSGVYDSICQSYWGSLRVNDVKMNPRMVAELAIRTVWM